MLEETPDYDYHNDDGTPAPPALTTTPHPALRLEQRRGSKMDIGSTNQTRARARVPWDIKRKNVPLTPLGQARPS